MKKPRISVILPVWNAGAFAAEALTSILTQTFDDFEVIAIDDGSTDDSLHHLRHAAGNDRRVHLLSRENRGLVPTLNEAIGHATGEFLARMDADDLSLPDRFARQVQYLDATPNVGVVGSWVERVGAEAGVRPYPTDPGIVMGALVFRNPLAHPTVMMRRSLLLDAGLHYELTARHTEDYALWLAVSQRTLLANVPEVLLKYRVHPRQVSAVHAQEQETRTVQLQLRFLAERLAIESSAAEARIHRALSFSKFEATDEFVASAEAWLLRIGKANELLGHLPREGLLRALTGRFVSLRHFARGCGLTASRDIPALFAPIVRPGALA